MLVVKFGQVSAMDVFSRKYLSAVREIDIARTKNYGAWAAECFGAVAGILPIYFMLGRESMCMEVLEVWGLSNDNDIERCCLTVYHSVGQRMRAYFDNMKTFCQLYLGVLNPDILIDGVKFDAWIPAPTALA